MTQKLYLYPVFLRIWHGLNALLFLVLILTGLSMQYSDPGAPWIRFELSVQLHNICGITLTANYLLFILGNAISGNGKQYRIQWKGLSGRLMKQARYYLQGYFRKSEHPFPVSEEKKFNPLQGLTYAMAMYIGLPVIIITGFGLLFPDTVLYQFMGLSGLLITDLLHVATGFLLSIFMVIHIYLCSIGANPAKNYRAIISGWHEHA
jgi:thiosulfate reductase cytochrome b subunit